MDIKSKAPRGPAVPSTPLPKAPETLDLAQLHPLQALLSECDVALRAWSKRKQYISSQLRAVGIDFAKRPPATGTQGDLALVLAQDSDVDIPTTSKSLGIPYGQAANLLRSLVQRGYMFQPSRGLYRTRSTVTTADQ